MARSSTLISEAAARYEDIELHETPSTEPECAAVPGIKSTTQAPQSVVVKAGIGRAAEMPTTPRQ